MNFNDGKTEKPATTLTPDPTSKEGIEEAGKSTLDRTAMEAATKAQKHQHENANTNSSNTIFSK